MLVVANWKMNTDRAEAVALADAVVDAVAAGAAGGADVAVCPPFVWLDAVGGVAGGTPVALGAQDVHAEEEGAFTGAVSAAMLVELGCRYAIVGHSERRQLFGETDAAVGAKLRRALVHGLVPILCVGETLDEREGGQAEAVVARQLAAALDGVALERADALVVAYEPVWAIGTGRTATPEQAQAMHAFARGRLAEALGVVGRGVRLLYGGSVKADNAATLFAQPDVDGALVGGASLDAAAFTAILQAAGAAVKVA